jgi:Tetratricopeptide repeat/PEGA domain
VAAKPVDLIKRALFVGWVALIATFASSAHAADEDPANKAAARELFREASRLGKSGDWQGARERYQRSLALHPAAITLYSLGVAQRETGALVAALESYRAYLRAEKSDATMRYEDTAKQAVRALESAVAHVAIQVLPMDDATVSLDGQELPSAALGVSRLMDPGTHVVIASAPGHEEVRRSLQIARGETTQIDLVLPRAEQAPSDSGTSQATSSFPTGPVVVMAVGGAVGLSGLVVGAVGLSQASGAVAGSSAASAAKRKGLAADVMLGVGGVGVVAGLVWWLALPDDDGDELATVAPWFAGPVGGLQLRF